MIKTIYKNYQELEEPLSWILAEIVKAIEHLYDF